METKRIFDPITFGKLSLPNRIFRSATMERGTSNEGVIDSQALSKVYSDLADGEVGLIITGMMSVGPSSRVSGQMAAVDHETFHENFSRVVESVRARNRELVVQLSHCGAKAEDYPQKGIVYAPSDVEVIPGRPAMAMPVTEIHRMAEAFGRAAEKCKTAGASGVQIHAAHGYMLSQFLSPYYNKRDDEYGGNIEGRAKAVFECYDAVRVGVGANFPVWIKINYTDLVEPGLSGEESLWVCKELEKRGIDAVEISSGLAISSASKPSKVGVTADSEGSYAEGALKIASELKSSVVSVCGYRSIEGIEEILNQGKIEAVSLCRPLIREPNLVKRWKNGDKRPSTCISCNRCFGHMLECQVK